MTSKEIKNRQKKIYNLLTDRRLKEAFGILSELIAILQDGHISDKLNEIETSYKYMIRYMLDGFNDPERKKIYDKLVLSTYNLTDLVTEILLEKESGDFYYSKKRYQNIQPPGYLQRCFEEVDNAINNLSLNSLLEDNENNDEEKFRLKQETEHTGLELFTAIMTNYPTNETDYQSIGNAINEQIFPVQTTCLIISALTLNLLHRYDEKKLHILLDGYSSPAEEIKQRALCGALIIIYMYKERLALTPSIAERIESLKENSNFCTDSRNIFLQFIKSRETERISRKFTEELLPEMMKISPSLYKKIKPDELMSDINSLEKNPEWQEILDEAGITDKLKELSNLQMEGADVFMSTFSNLKSFPFFSEAGNWLLPFSTDHTSLRNIFNSGEGSVSFKSIITSSRFLCNSDKYSFCLSLTQVPDAQRKMMISQFSNEGSEMENIEKEEAMLTANKKGENISNQYLQDLYRFFKLFPRKNEFSDPFATDLNLLHVPILESIFSGEESLRLIGELYFRKDYYTDALEIFNMLAEKQQSNSELYQKTGYCLQMIGDHEKALEAYLKAEMIHPDSVWTLRRIAQCYRNLKKPEMALEYYHRVEKLRPDNLSVELNIGHCYLEQKDYGAALRHYFKVDYLDPKSTKAWRPIAWCSFLIGKSEQARRYYEKILEDKPSALDFMNAGHVEFALGNIRKAIEYYRNSITLEDGDMKKFMQNFKQDTPELIDAGISSNDIPILLDQLMYSITD